MAVAAMTGPGPQHEEEAKSSSTDDNPAPDGPISQSPQAPAAGASIADGTERRLDPRWIALQRISGSIFAAVVTGANLVAFVGALLAGDVPAWGLSLWGGVGLLVSLAILGFALGWPVVDHRHSAYRLDAQRLEIRRGVVWRRIIDVPRSRVQHTDVSQGPLERYFGLGTLVVFTAGTDHAKVELPGLSHATALQIRSHLLPGESPDAV
jgi:membrane protein YdbS with pleckstrin-like domain